MLAVTFPVFKERMTRRYLSGQAASIVGQWTQNVTLNLLLWQLTHSPWMLGVLNFLLYCPALVIPLLFGSRLTPSRVKGIMMKTLTASMLVSATLLTAVLTGVITPTFLLLMAAVAGCIASLELPTRQLMLTSSLQDTSLMYNAVAMNTLVFNLGRMCGPALAAWSFNHVGPAAGFALCWAGLCVMFFAVRGIEVIKRDGSARRAGGMLTTLRYVRGNPFATTFLPMLAFLGIFAGSYQSLIPVLAAQGFHDTAKFTGWFFSSAGIGSLLSALFISARVSHQQLTRWLRIASWSTAGSLAIIAFSLSPLLTCFGFGLLGLSLTFCATMINSTLQHQSPPELRGGVVGLYGMAFQGTMPIGNLLVGMLATFSGVMHTFLFMSVMLAILLGAQWGICQWQRNTGQQNNE